MHPTIGYDLATAEIAARRQQAQRDALARAGRARRHQPRHQVPRMGAAVTRRVLAILGARST